MAKRYYQQTWSESDEVVAKAASDPNCKNQQECLDVLAERKATRAVQEKQEAARAVQEKIRRETVRAELQDNPFDPRHEISADAKHIAKVVGGHEMHVSLPANRNALVDYFRRAAFYVGASVCHSEMKGCQNNELKSW